MRRFLCVLMLFVGCGAGLRPDQELEQARAALTALPVEQAKNMRFLSLATIPEEERALAAGIASFALNSLGDSGYVARPEWIPGTDLLAFNLRNYTASEETYKTHWQTWETLAEIEPFFHVRTQVAVPPKKDAKGKETVAAEIKDVTIDAPWLPEALAKEVRETSASIGPVMRLEWWLAKVMQPPHYYALAGVPATELEFLKVLGIDPAEVRKLGADKGANVISRIAFGHPRRVSSYIGPLGTLFVTKDVFVANGKRDAIRQPLNTATNPQSGELVRLFEFDASEYIAAKANGLHLFALYDSAGNRQDAVPLGGPGKSIARDTSEDHPGFDGVVVPGLSCVRCHREQGMRDLNDVQSTLFGLASLQDAQAIRSFYNPPLLQMRLKQAREQYGVALQAATDLSSEQVADGLGKLARVQLYDLVTPERAAVECGVPVEEFSQVIRGIPDPYCQLLSQGLAIHRECWEPTFAVVMSAWPKVEAPAVEGAEHE